MKNKDLTTEAIYCGSSGLMLRQFLGTNVRENALDWFSGGEYFFVHKARTGIRHLRTLLKCELGSEILTPSYNCGTEIDALIESGFHVVLFRVDCSGRLDFEDLQRRCSPRTRAIYVIHYFGFPQPMDEIREWCNKRNLFLVEDCALALFSSDRGSRLGTIGDAAVFSLPKTLPVPDGGVLQVNNTHIDANSWRLKKPDTTSVFRGLLPIAKSSYLRQLSRHSKMHDGLRTLLQVATKKKSNSEPIAIDHFPDMPLNYYFDAALEDLAISSLTFHLLQTFSSVVVRERRRENYLLSLQFLSGKAGATPLYSDLPEGVCPLWFPILVDDPGSFSKVLQEKSVGSIAWWSGFHRKFHWEAFPGACFLKKHVLALPIHQDLGPREIEHICRSFLEILEGRA